MRELLLKWKLMIVDILFIRVMILWSFVKLCVDEKLVMRIVSKGLEPTS